MLRCCFVAISNLRLTASAECYKRFHDHCYTTKQTFENLTWKIPLVIKLACRFNSIHTNCSYSSYQQSGKNVAQQQQKQNKSRKLKKKKQTEIETNRIVQWKSPKTHIYFDLVQFDYFVLFHYSWHFGQYLRKMALCVTHIIRLSQMFCRHTKTNTKKTEKSRK